MSDSTKKSCLFRKKFLRVSHVKVYKKIWFFCKGVPQGVAYWGNFFRIFNSRSFSKKFETLGWRGLRRAKTSFLSKLQAKEGCWKEDCEATTGLERCAGYCGTGKLNGANNQKLTAAVWLTYNCFVLFLFRFVTTNGGAFLRFWVDL